MTARPERSSLPELVDLKITDFCPFNCGFCYMGSTVKGEHAHARTIKGIVAELAKAQVFEIAIGGGEPTLHPDFVDICKDIAYHGISCNFTTKSLAWLRDLKQALPIVETCTAFAFSADSVEDVQEVHDAWAPYRSQIVCNIQLVVGVVTERDLAAILVQAKELRLPVTLLGFKTTGRGGRFHRDAYDWLQVVKDAGYSRIGIDTVLAATLEGQEDVPDLFYHTKEGAWSMYVDATTQRAGPSSYCAPEKMVDIVTYPSFDREKRFPRVTDLDKVFQSLQPE